MKTSLRTILCAAAAALALASCQKPAAERLAGGYTCVSNAVVGVDDHPIKTDNETVSISRIDDNTVKITTRSRRWGEAEFEHVEISDYNSTCNFSGDGKARMPGVNTPYDAYLSGSFVYDSKALAVSVSVKGYSSRCVITFTNTEYSKL